MLFIGLPYRLALQLLFWSTQSSLWNILLETRSSILTSGQDAQNPISYLFSNTVPIKLNPFKPTRIGLPILNTNYDRLCNMVTKIQLSHFQKYKKPDLLYKN